jgi:hypothetical protein
MNETPPVDTTGTNKSVESIFSNITSFIRTKSLKEAFVYENQSKKLLKDGDCWKAFGFVSANLLQKSTYVERKEERINDGRQIVFKKSS